MAIKILGKNTTSALAVDPAALSARLSLRPEPGQFRSYHQLALQSGLITGVGNGQAVFALRYWGPNRLLIRRAGCGFITTTAFTTAQLVSFGLLQARQYQAFETGGTQVFIIPNSVNLQHGNTKARSRLPQLSAVDFRISTTAALTAAAQRATDTNLLGCVGGYSGGVGATIPPAQDNLFSHALGDYPLVLEFNQGVLVTTGAAMGAAGVGVFYINLEMAEVETF